MTLDVQSDTFLIAVMGIDVDKPKLIKTTRDVVADYKATYADTTDFTRPYTIVLSESEQDAEQAGLVQYDKVHNTKYFDRSAQATLAKRYEDTEFATLARVLPFPFSIIRLSVLPPKTIIGMHTDDACHAQLAMYTNPDCFVAARTGETCHVPVDGQLYIISTTIPHTAFNASDEERVHISISIFDEDYIKLLKKHRGRLQKS